MKAKKMSGPRFYSRAKKIIVGGNMFLSKKPEMLLPKKWPTYFSKSKGCKVWDLDGNKYIDLCLMGVGTNILGYNNLKVDEAVKKTISKGNISTLNCPEEVFLAEKLIQLHPWADKVKFARTGGEANAISIRIARAATGKDSVAVCGYHGWHDWYLAANLENNKNLDKHHIKNLRSKGIPKSLAKSIYTFEYNDYETLERIVEKKDIGIIKMEVSRNIKPKKNFLEKIRNLSTKKGIILIFDECSSAFRKVFGGLHKFYNIEPDMAIFGKALGNGYAITAVIGKKEYMDYAEASFISSTFWTERIGPTAALETLKEMKRLKSWEKINKIGLKINNHWKKLMLKHNIAADIYGLPSLTSFIINSKNWLKYKTFITQEMLKKGILATNSVYVCTEHSSDIIERYIFELDKIFRIISDCEIGRNIDDLLEGPICLSGLPRMN